MNEVRREPWLVAIETAARKDCSTYATALREAANAASPIEAERLRLLAAVAEMALSLGAGVEPLNAAFSGPRGRTAIPDDLSLAELDELCVVLSQAQDAELAARICDVLWTRRRLPTHARQGAAAYLDAACELEADCGLWRVRVERGLAFARVINDRDQGLRAVEYLKRKVEDIQTPDLALLALDLLLKFGANDAGHWAERKYQP